ncbi:YgcG family protein, partial [Mycobacterium tuberculosis]
LTNTLGASEAEALRQDITALEGSTQAQLAVLIVPTTGQEAIEQYATRVFAKWKLGRKDEDDGVLVLVALKDRKMRIEVGKGLEGTITDIQAAAIIDRQMAPRFRNGDYAGGVQAAVRALSQLIGPPTAQ